MSMLDMVDRLVFDLTTGTPATLNELRTDGLDALDLHIDNVLQERSNTGARVNRLEVTEAQLGDLEARLTEARSNIADVDMARAYVEFESHSTMYQSALAAGSRIMQTSILDFL
jgi:flagellar hook-associated protein 3 FlgL